MENCTITYICGHTQVKPISKTSPHECYKECPACREKAQKEFFENITLPALTGSEKQIAWATDIRNSFCENRENEAKYTKKQIYVLENFTESKSWIDQRGNFKDGKLPMSVRYSNTI